MLLRRLSLFACFAILLGVGCSSLAAAEPLPREQAARAATESEVSSHGDRDSAGALPASALTGDVLSAREPSVHGPDVAAPAATTAAPAASSASARTFAAPPTAAAGPADAARAEPAPAAIRASDRSPQVPLAGNEVLREVGPPVYYLPDKFGKLQAVLGFTLEDFEKLYDLRSGAARPRERPRYSIQRLSVTGVANPSTADLEAHFSIETLDDRWVRVPLRFDDATLTEPAAHQGPGECIVDFATGDEGYVCWLHGPSGARHEVALKLRVPLNALADAMQMRLAVPRAASSELQLQTAIADAVARVGEGETAERSELPAGSGTRFRVLGIAGDFAMTWSREGSKSFGTESAMEVTGEILARLDPRGVETRAKLTVGSFGGPMSSFRVRLPPRAEWIPALEAGYTMEALPDATVNDRKTVEIRLLQKSAGPVSVEISARTPQATAAGGDEWLELAGFEVLGAARQSGTVTVVTDADWQILWGVSKNVRPIDATPADHEESPPAYQYFAQPFSLPARLVPRSTRTTVEPEYRLRVRADRLELETNLRYTVRGAKITDLGVALGDWRLDNVGPEDRVAWDMTAPSDAQNWRLPLLAPVSGVFEIQLSAHLPLPGRSGRLNFRLPQPRATAVAPATLTVTADENVELTPDPSASLGLARESPPQGAARRQWFYRGEMGNEPFAADFRVQPRKTEIAIAATIDLGADESLVEQRLDYTIAYEPASSLTLYVPDALVGGESLDLKVGGASAVAVPLAGEPQHAGLQALRVSLPEPVLGHIDVTAKFPAPRAPTGNDWSRYNLTLLEPAIEGFTDVVERRALVKAEPGIEVACHDGAWREVQANASLMDPAIALVADGPAERLELHMRRSPVRVSGQTVVEQALVQTWSDGAERLDRAIFRIASSRDQVLLQLPHGVSTDQVVVFVDGHIDLPRPSAPDGLRISLAADRPLRRHVIIVSYPLPDTSGPQRRYELPRIEDDAWVRQVFWQLAVPPQQHLLAGPAAMIHEYSWNFGGWGWHREAAVDIGQLERPAANGPHTPMPTECNRYLFSSFGPVAEIEVAVVHRSTLVLVASGVALAVGLIWLYLGAVRRPAVLLVIGIGLLAAGAMYPETAVLVAQAAVLGVVLGALAFVLHWAVARPTADIAPALPERGALSHETAVPRAARVEPTATREAAAPAAQTEELAP